MNRKRRQLWSPCAYLGLSDIRTDDRARWLAQWNSRRRAAHRQELADRGCRPIR